MSPRLDLVAVVLEATVPVLRHLRDLVAQHVQDLLDRFLVDHPAQAGQRSVLRRDSHRHVVVKDLDREVLAAFAEHLHLLLLQHLACPVMGVHDMVAELELDVLDFARRLELDLQRFLLNCLWRNGVLLCFGRPLWWPVVQVCR